MFLLITVISYAVAVTCDVASVSDLTKREPIYFFTYPRALLAEKNETFCLNLQNVNLPSKTIIDLKIGQKHNIITKSIYHDHTCFEFPVPKQKSGDVMRSSLHVQIQVNGVIQTGHSQEAIMIHPRKDAVFMETDRAIYKPGDKVLVRVLTLNELLKPSADQLPDVKLINPKGFIVNVWNKLKTETGFVQFDYQLAEDTVLGKWRLECENVVRHLQVKRYVLPRFKVEVTVAKVIYSEIDVIPVTACATYSFGKYVRGIVMVKMSNGREGMHQYATKIGNLKNGCLKFNFTNVELKLSFGVSQQAKSYNLNLVATVTEDFSNRLETENVLITVRTHRYRLKFAENKFFQPGMPYRGRLKVIDKHVDDVTSDSMEICYEIAVKKSWNVKLKECGTFRLDGDDGVDFTLLSFKENVVQINLYAKSLNSSGNIADQTILRKWHSASGNYIQIEPEDRMPAKCKSNLHYTVYHTSNFASNETVTFYYMLKSRNEILQAKRITRAASRDQTNHSNVIGQANKFTRGDASRGASFVLKVRPPDTLHAKGLLLVYYFYRGELIGAVSDIHLDKCLGNKVDVKFSSPEYVPGGKATLRVKTSPGAVCSVTSIDRAVQYAPALAKRLTAATVLQYFAQEREAATANRANCLNQKRKSDQKPEKLIEDLRRRKRQIGMTMYPEDYDVHEMFSNAGLAVITNQKTILKPCNFNPMPVIQQPVSYDVSPDDRATSTVRSRFPETWLWDLVRADEYGVATIEKNIPHSITAYATDVTCVSNEEGVGFAARSEAVSYQPFFIDVLTPYAIKRKETFNLQVLVHNYMNLSLPVRVTLGNATVLELIEGAAKRKKTVCVQADDTRTVTFRVAGASLGRGDVTVLAEVESGFPGECGPEVILNRRDVVRKSLVVEPEGYEVEYARSGLLCGGETNLTWPIELSNDTVPDSVRAKIIFNSDLMGPIIQNLEKFLTVPYGCGEQVMSVLAPNLYVIRYLSSVGKLTPAYKQRAVRNIKIGYQRVLDHLHNDGSFSAFGYHDSAGSMFLTAFVLRTLHQAKGHTYVDARILSEAAAWIARHQLENGCFAAVSHVFQDMGGTSGENSTAALTAYVVISLLESGTEAKHALLSNALYCIRGQQQQHADKYTLAISAYALRLMGLGDEAERYVARLLDVANRDGKTMWWSNPSGPVSTNVEMTAYVLLALLQDPSKENLLHASSIVRWLSTQRGTHGGFVTSQDTSVALDALSRYGSLVKNWDADLKVVANLGDGKTSEVILLHGDAQKTKEIPIYKIPDKINLAAWGKGCLLTQLSVVYNMRKMLTAEALRLDVDAVPASTIDKCSVLVITPCVSYAGSDRINMAVLEVSVPSGYEPERSSLYRLLDEENGIKKFEELSNRVILYFTELTNEIKCAQFNINEHVNVDGALNATVKLYDYYRPELQTISVYKLSKCQPNEVMLIPSLGEPAQDPISLATSAKPQKRDLRGKKPRVSNYGLNKDFVDMDVEMATPSGIEGNIPMYIKPTTG